MSADMSLGTAIGIDAGVAYAIVVLSVLMLPETRDRTLGAASKSLSPADAAASKGRA
jgi:hypothetical protein